jgi:alkaline phosphatase
MATGNKTDNVMLSYFPNDQTLETILEISIDRNMSTGLVTTTEIFHATPAAFYSHVDSRTNTSEIVNQLSQQSKIEVIFGGGSNAFSAAILTEMEQNGYTYITNRSQLTSISEGKVLGLFSTLSIPYEQVRDPELTPSLSEMTNKALEVVSQDNDGFFLLIEGGKIDWGAHANNKNNTALEVIEFDKAVGNVKNFVETQTDHDILFLVTADHETGGLSVKSNTLNSSLPSDTKTHTQNKALRLARTENISLSWSSPGHTGREVPLFGFGTVLNSINESIIDNTEIFRIMKDHYQVPPDEKSSGSTTFSSLPPTTKPISWSSFSILLSLSTAILIYLIRRTTSVKKK